MKEGFEDRKRRRHGEKSDMEGKWRDGFVRTDLYVSIERMSRREVEPGQSKQVD